MFRELESGAKTGRTLLHRTLHQFEAADLLMVTRLDRPARSAHDLLNALATITERKAGFRILGDAWVDITTPQGRLMLTAPGGLAEFKSGLIRALAGEDRACARAQGKSIERPFKLTAHQRQEALARSEDGERLSEIAYSYGVNSSTISRLA